MARGIGWWFGAGCALVVLSSGGAPASDYSHLCESADGAFVVEDTELFETSAHRAGSAAALPYTVLSETVEAEETGYCASWAKGADGSTFDFKYRRYVQRITFEFGGKRRNVEMRCTLEADGLPASFDCDRRVVARRQGVVAETPAAASLWSHNGSMLALVVEGDQRSFVYTAPRAGLVSNGVRPGTLLFDGQSDGRRYQGRARLFTQRCGELSYAVSGPIERGGARVVLLGKAPRLDAQCKLTGWTDDRLVFDLKESAPSTQTQNNTSAGAGMARAEGDRLQMPPAAAQRTADPARPGANASRADGIGGTQIGPDLTVDAPRKPADEARTDKSNADRDKPKESVAVIRDKGKDEAEKTARPVGREIGAAGATAVKQPLPPDGVETETGRIDAMRVFRVVVPSIWAGASDARGFHVKRQSAKGGAIHQMCPYPAEVYAEANGKVDPSFKPRTIADIRLKLEAEAAEHRKWGREPEIRPFAIGPFQGFLLETRMRFARGGWSHSGYLDSGTEALGHGWVTAEGRTFEVSYGVGSSGCWDNSQRPFQESQTLAAQREAQAILAGLRLVAEPGVTQAPYTGPKLDGSDLPVVRLDPPKLKRLHAGETAIVRAVVENSSPEDRPLRFEWTGEYEGAGEDILIRATKPGTFSLSVTVEGARHALGTASLSYEVSNLQVRVERRSPFKTGPVPAGTKITLEAVLTADGQAATGEFVYRWQPHPEVRFEPQDTSTASTAPVTAVFPEPGRYLVWVQVLRREGEILSTVIQSEQIEIVVEREAGATSPKDTLVIEGRPFGGASPVPPESCWHSLNPDPRGWTPMPMAPLHPTTRVNPGNYVVLVGPSGIGGKRIPETWRTFGPFRIDGGHAYGATIKDTGDRLIWEKDPLILATFATADSRDPSAYIYVRNDAFLVDHWHAICVLPAPAPAPAVSTDAADEPTGKSSATARTERWKVRLDPGPYMSTFELRIDADGNVDGVSHWTCCSGPVNRISGRITPTGDIQLTRHLEAPHTGMSHVWTGRYASPKAVEGTWSSRSYGHGSGPWRAEVESTDGR